MDYSIDDASFPAPFVLEPGALSPGRPDEVVYYPGATTLGGRDGMLLRVVPPERSGVAPWTGMFASGEYSRASPKHAAITLPGSVRFLVVSDGAGYVVAAADPADWADVPVSPVRSVVPVLDRRLVVLADRTRLSALGAGGVVWGSATLAWDNLRVVRVEGDWIVARGHDASRQRAPTFHVDLATGRSDDKPYPDER